MTNQTDYRPHFENLKELLLRLSNHRSAESVARGMVDSLIEARPHIGRVAVWLADGERLVLVAQAKQAEFGACPAFDDRGGEFATLRPTDWLPCAALSTQRVSVARHPADWPCYPDWAQQERMVSLVTAPIAFNDRLLGFFAAFLRYPINDDLAWEQGRSWTQLLTEYLASIISNAMAYEELAQLKQQLEQENEYLREQEAARSGLGDAIGESASLRHAFDQVRLVAPTDANVLILGETGTGKEVFAKLIHQHSRRSKGPLIKVNCAAIPRELFESEFFGHVKGSFTGAIRDRLGRFQLADGGTLFLDEIGEVPIDLQGKLLRVLQEGIVERIGEERSRHVDVRVIAATNRDLKQEIVAKSFREDLYYRLSVFPIRLPPLRERIDDVPLLAQHFIDQASRQFGRKRLKLKSAHVQQLQAYAWPGNVRELQHVMERSVIISDASSLVLAMESSPSPAVPNAPAISPGSATSPESTATAGDDRVLTYAELESLEKQNLTRALEATGGRVSGARGAAVLLGVPPSTLASRIKSLGVRKS